MRINRTNISASVCALLLLAACDTEKVYDTGYPEASLISEINFDYEGQLTLPVGMELPLSVTVTPAEAAAAGVIYKSSDETIAYIDENQTLHCVKEGVANVSCLPSIGFGPSAKLTVTVAESVNYAESLTVEPAGELGEYIYEGDTFALKAVILPEEHTYDFVDWSSSDESVLTVDKEGTVSCVSPGTASITAVTRFPDKAGVSGSMSFTVSEPVDVQSVTVTAPAEAICVSRPFDLEVAYTPAYGTRGSVDWTSSDEAVAYVNRGHVTPTGFGTCDITATCRATGQSSTVTVTVTAGWYIWDSVNKWLPWKAGSNAGFTYHDDCIEVKLSEMSAGGQWRGDLLLVNDANNPVAFHFGEYPVIALRTTIPPDGRNTFDGVSAEGVNAGNPQCNEGRFATGNPITLSDGTKLIYVDMGSRGKYSTSDFTYMKLLQLKVADIPAENVSPDKTYKVFWIRTFRSVQEMKDFAEAEGDVI